MKQQNRKSYSLAIYSELLFIFLLLIGMVALFLFLFDSAFPVFKYSLLCIKIITCVILIASIIGLIHIIRIWRKGSLSTLSNYKKITYSLICLLWSFLFLSSIEYLIYIHNKDKFNIENNYINAFTEDKISSLRQEIEHCKKYVDSYNHIYDGLMNKEYVEYHSIDDFYFIVINGDTIELKIQQRQKPGTGTVGMRFDRGINSAEPIGIALKNEPYNSFHPRSEAILKSMQKNDNIKCDELRLLVSQKREMYQDRIEEYKVILEGEVVITFGDFIIYNIFNPSITGNKTHIFIRLIFLLQAIVITFFSGYIYQTLYKILDGEKYNNPEH